VTQDPYAAPRAPLEVEVSALREADFLKSYVCYAVCSVLVGAVAGALIGGLIGAAAGAGGTIGPSTRTVVLVASTAAGLIVNYFVFRFFVIRFIVVRFVPELKRAA
jgi:energy-converting hydrogenase Eha subunit B